jgi:hypothetical protein
MHNTLKALWMVFILPIIFGLMLAAFGYIGKPVNQGTWVSPPLLLSNFTPTIPSDRYEWTVLYPCHICVEKTKLKHAISTLGTKAKMVNIMTPSHLDIVDETHLFLADPHQNIILQYDASKPLELAKDLKRLLKSVSQ